VGGFGEVLHQGIVPLLDVENLENVFITMANITRAVGVKDYFAGKTRWNCTSLRWGGAVATSAATRCLVLLLI
jgi:hypothetical protein